MPAYVFLAATVAFIVYGSLFPFDFVSPGLPIDSFFAEYHVFANRSDALDNFFLFVPLGIGLAVAFRRPAARSAAALMAILVLAIGIQLVQLYLPSRVASAADAFWNTVGMGAGFLIAARVRHALRAQLVGHEAGGDLFAAGLLLLWLLYESFPFVPTLDIGLLREHVKGAVFAPTFELMRLVQHALAAALAGIAAARVGLLRRPARGVIALAALALTLEVLVPYGSLRRETLIGIALGLGGGYLAAQWRRDRGASIAFALALAAYLITVLTPYRGQAADAGFTFTPFSHVLWHGAVNDVPPAAFEALAIGALMWSGMAAAPRLRAQPILWSAAVLLLLAALEWVRVAVAGFHGDTTALAMAIVLAPAAVALRAHGQAPPLAAVPAAPALAGAARPAWMLGAASAAALTVAMWLVLKLPGIPYNLKKLFGDQPLFGAAVFSLALLWLGGGPWLVARTVLRLDARRRRGELWAPLLTAGIALVSYLLVDLATPAIMLEKIIGAPDLYRRIVEDNYWGEAWRAGLAAWPAGLVRAGERLLRYLALYSVFTIPLVLALLAIPRRERSARIILNGLCLLPFWLLGKFIVLDWAVTDNLTELVADGGAVFLALLIALFAVNAVLLAGYRRGASTAPVLAVVTALLAGVDWWLLNLGIEPVVINNGRIFSGVQFLLGENRSALLSAPALFARWCALDGAALAVVVTGMLLARRLLPLPEPAGNGRRAG
ncbi:MAG: VanZ family protein [Nevskia sp.]|nr:VanZ family protein [Nevskia sp.]